jgi:hypothetical protein
MCERQKVDTKPYLIPPIQDHHVHYAPGRRFECESIPCDFRGEAPLANKESARALI